jgi:UDP-N-acetylglucosamine acyltransferase
MAYVHLAHDCMVGSHTILANCAQLGGHVHVGDYAIVGGMTGVHQFCRIGAHAMTGAGSVVLADVPPYVTAMGNTAEPHGINSEGLRRRGFSAEVVNNIRRAYKTLYKSGLTLDEAKRALHEQAAACRELVILVDFLDASKRSIIR